METRGSDKHGSRIDQEMDREVESMTRGSPVESRADEGREQESPGPGEPTPDARLRGERAIPLPGELSLDDVEARAEIARYLQPSEFPKEREDLLESARSQHAPDAVMELLELLPEGVYDNMQVVWRGLCGAAEQRR